MFRPEDILARLMVRPFRPIRIIASEGREYEIRQPELVMVCVSRLLIGDEMPGVPGIYNRINYVALDHIVGIEEISAPPSETNGTAG